MLRKASESKTQINMDTYLYMHISVYCLFMYAFVYVRSCFYLSESTPDSKHALKAVLNARNIYRRCQAMDALLGLRKVIKGVAGSVPKASQADELGSQLLKA